MAGEQKSRYFHLTNSLKRVGRYLGRGNRRSIAQAVLQNPNLRHHVIDEVAKGIRKEIKKLCSKKIRFHSKNENEASTGELPLGKNSG